MCADFQFRWYDGGSAAGSAAALEEPRGVQSVQAPAAFDCSVVEAPLCCDVTATVFVGESSALVTGAAGDATIVLGDNGGCACAATDLKDATNSKGMGNNTFASAFREFDIDEVSIAKDHGEATSAQGSTHSTAFSLMNRSLIRGCRPNSFYHPIHACAHSRLDGCGVGSGVGAGVGAGAVVSCVDSSGVVDDVDDACVDGSALDVIRRGSNSVIQSFSEYHDSSCARLNALQNSHLECGRHVQEGMKRSRTGSLCKVRLSAGKNRSFSQQQSRKVHGEVWAGLLKKQGPLSSREVEIVPGCAAMVACPSCPDNSIEPPGPGRVIRNMLGWSQLEKTARSGVWLFRGALQGESLFSSLVAAGDWVRKGSYHTAWSVPFLFFVLLFVCVRARPRYGATHWKAVLASSGPFVEGYRSPDEAVVC